MSYLDLVDSVTLFRSLHHIDVELAERVRSRGCPLAGCGGPLHWATYARQPRGERIDIPEEFKTRLGLCCGWCRRRTLPPSCLFFGRTIFWGCITLLVPGAAQGLENRTLAELCQRFTVSRRTIKRWLGFFAVAFPASPHWLALRGRVAPVVSNDELPRALLVHFFGTASTAREGLVGCLVFVSGANGLRWARATRIHAEDAQVSRSQR